MENCDNLLDSLALQMELWDKPSAVRTLAPLEYHMRACTTIVGGDHSKL